MRKIILCVLFFLPAFHSNAQLAFLRYDSIPVFENSQQLLYPWAGGMNFCQYSNIDLNLDGMDDLFVFDRSGNRMITFINHGTSNTVDYTLDQDYAYKFPLLHDWVLLRDYNCDGKADIFTSSGPGTTGIDVWMNTSSVANGLQFQQVASVLQSDFFPNSSHQMQTLRVTNVDIPAIRDVDHDGDIDVLTYDVSGVNVEFHRNMSKENYGTCDSLVYRLESMCWGEFAENTLNATLTLNSPCSNPPIRDHSDNSTHHNIHNGSCLECINTDGDADQDILIGDITNPFVVYGRNGFDSSYAKMDLVDNTFPTYDQPVNMNVWNCGFHVDVDNDGKRDVIFSPNAPNASENYRSSWYYHNTGQDDSVILSFIGNSFLQDEMIEVGEGAFPRFFDYDNDGDQDLFIGNYGYYSSSSAYPAKIALYENQGSSSSASYRLITPDFANIFANTLNIPCPVPTFADLDGDGDKDMIVGDAIGKLHLFRKDPGPANNFVLQTSNYMGIDVGNFATPQLVDVDRDGLVDLLIGEQSGNIDYYRNTGTASVPNFALITALFGNVIVNQVGYITGYSTPFLWDSAGTYILLSGCERGFIFRYDNIDGNLTGNFTLTDSLYVSAREGARSCPWMADLNNDSLTDLIIGNYAGGVSFFRRTLLTGMEEQQLLDHSLSIYPNPAHSIFNIQLSEDVRDLPVKVSVFDMNGRSILTREINDRNITVSTVGMASGVYICKLEMKNGVVLRKKLIIEN